MDETWEYERRGSRTLWWILWGGSGAATAGEVALFTLMRAPGADPATSGALPGSQLAVVALLAGVMVVLAGCTKGFRLGGGGFPTALVTWALLKGVAIAGLVVFQLAESYLYYGPFLAAFAAGMLLANPTRFETPDSPASSPNPDG